MKGGFRASAGRPRGSRTVTEPALNSLNGKRAVGHARVTPIEHLLAVVNDPSADEARRDRCAIALLPFLHLRAVEKVPTGKKEQARAEAETAHRDTPWETLLG